MDNDASKICFFITGYGVDAKCAEYCWKKSKTTGSCKNKRCVCSTGLYGQNDSHENNNGRFPSLFFGIPKKSDMDCTNACQLNCKNMGKSNGSCLTGPCICSRL
jgi:hypothetical protein